jgi:hypothetical protein
MERVTRTVMHVVVVLSSLLAVSVYGMLTPAQVRGFRYPITWRLNSIAEKVLQNPKWPPEWPFSDDDFKRMDESDDSIFYDSPRLVSVALGALHRIFDSDLLLTEAAYIMCIMLTDSQ